MYFSQKMHYLFYAEYLMQGVENSCLRMNDWTNSMKFKNTIIRASFKSLQLIEVNRYFS